METPLFDRRRDHQTPADGTQQTDPDALPGVLTERAVETADTAETLRRRLSRLALDVHDGPMQNLTAIGYYLADLRSAVQKQLPPDQHPSIEASIEHLTDELSKVEQWLRKLIAASDSAPTEQVSSREAIEAVVADFARRSPAHIELVVEGDVDVETDSQRIALQSIAGEALANVLQHADAHCVTVSLRGTAESIELGVSDDGRGFSSEEPVNPGRLGLVGMKERAELLGGTFQIESRPGGPTVVSARLQRWRP